MDRCYFCDKNLHSGSVVSEDSLSLVLRDNYPITYLHSLIVPKLHVENIFELDYSVYEHLFKQVKSESRKLLKIDNTIDGFNIGVNQGIMAGQTVMHVHIHLIPRRKGDSLNPKGGVRWIMPDKAKYW
jgi:ATP adenylyltransferase